MPTMADTENEQFFNEPEKDAAGNGVVQPEAEETGSDSLNLEEKEEAIQEAKAPPPPPPEDPTRNMSDGQKVDYWAKRAQHFESEYKTERQKGQEYSKKYGGLSREQEKTQRHNDNALFDESSIPPWATKDLGTYTRFIVDTAKKEFESLATDRQLDQRVESSESRAREIHNGEDGLPSYDELVDEYVVPIIEKNKKIYELLRQMPDPAEASYTLGFLLKYPKFADMIKSQSRDELVKTINSSAKFAATARGRNGGRQPTGKLTAPEIYAMTPEDFEAELTKFREEG